MRTVSHGQDVLRDGYTSDRRRPSEEISSIHDEPSMMLLAGDGDASVIVKPVQSRMCGVCDENMCTFEMKTPDWGSGRRPTLCPRPLGVSLKLCRLVFQVLLRISHLTLLTIPVFQP